MSFVFRGYLRLLQRYTLATQMGTSAVTASVGDLIYQTQFEDKRLSEVEWYRTRRMCIYGGLVWAPISNRWHTLVLNRINLQGRVKTVLARTAIDLSFFSPFATCLFYTSQGAFEGRPLRTPAVPDAPQGIYERLEERLLPTVQKQWAVWGPVNLINLSVIPVYGRPPFANMVSIGWNAFLAAGAARGGIPPGGNTMELETSLAAAEAME
ncbi:hypothetical protein JCM3775_000431 [Rhodotorula graminis]|uniref:Uncharacterized protein n=1 Tax=Rhodotorula graminis (strain WP1) TaxID=578459 RepID=A0A194SA52_RHOGW|nr:uncharacterized protein RHOBADRAFT_64494 [Rhodotorula graminis WP1]KPV77464.1 hypothetical protein RHOBADRAFT_64494 [Rhodotorula graminis WP1]